MSLPGVAEKSQTMTDARSPAQAPAPARVQPPTAAEMAAYHRDDEHAGAAIVILMATIFTLGLALYCYICYLAMQ